ncbi:hypothetical protein [Sulfobacillus thermosulfidooxidans]|uniref:hypothetical protein n=1 Tax=Sulfobacillus thermosulfidooxidans TaxID=28034 RepID=UPI00096B9093|nr:hypothetical protein [Sulfobacillus thermosulfidooxidans]OLZ08255.1 hypothetical protein BFX05_04240 [Sulfobacillus thermosulfidooxidans]OLZ13995.1 hypothetical protein BFX06_06700 [Sulfobacillus thermosulfidooxidans]OLZ19913.1 hypothetical protein BFX07_02160 [Sulfobacillus thermosulfidooxidans]
MEFGNHRPKIFFVENHAEKTKGMKAHDEACFFDKGARLHFKIGLVTWLKLLLFIRRRLATMKGMDKKGMDN